MPQLSSCKQNMYITWWVGPGGAMVAGTCGCMVSSGKNAGVVHDGVGSSRLSEPMGIG